MRVTREINLRTKRIEIMHKIMMETIVPHLLLARVGTEVFQKFPIGNIFSFYIVFFDLIIIIMLKLVDSRS